MWNDHGIRTERSQTPNQLFTAGILHLRNSGRNTIDFLDDVGDEYGVEDTPSPDVEDSEDTGVAVSELQLTANPLSEWDDHGVSMYLQTLDHGQVNLFT